MLKHCFSRSVKDTILLTYVALNSRELTALSTEKLLSLSETLRRGGFKNRNLKIDKPLAQTFLVKKVRYRNATLVTSPVKDANESFSHAHDMGFGQF